MSWEHRRTCAVARRLSVICTAVVAVGASHAASYCLSRRVWTPNNGWPNGPLQYGDVVQYSHCFDDGWGYGADTTVIQSYGAWNGISDYYITNGQELSHAHVDWGVGPVPDDDIVAYTTWGLSGIRLIDQNGHTANEVYSAWVVFDEQRYWEDRNGAVQPALREPAHAGIPKISVVTAHEAGHVAGIFDPVTGGHSPDPYDVMYAAYIGAAHNGVLSQRDRDTLYELYNLREFREDTP